MHRSCTSSSRRQITILGINSLFGKAVSFLLKQSPIANRLVLYDENNIDVGHDLAEISTSCKVVIYSGEEQLCCAVKNSDVILIGDKDDSVANADEAIQRRVSDMSKYAQAISHAAPNAIVLIAATPVNSMLPLFVEAQVCHGSFDCDRVMGVTSSDTMRASAVLAQHLKVNPEKVYLPVIGGSSADTRIPLFSQSRPGVSRTTKVDLRRMTRIIKMTDTEIYKLLNRGEALNKAYATVQLIDSVMSALKGQRNISEIVLTRTCSVPKVDYFSLPVILGPRGIAHRFPLPSLTERETILLGHAVKHIEIDTTKGVNAFFNLCTILEKPERNEKYEELIECDSKDVFLSKLLNKFRNCQECCQPKVEYLLLSKENNLKLPPETKPSLHPKRLPFIESDTSPQDGCCPVRLPCPPVTPIRGLNHIPPPHQRPKCNTSNPGCFYPPVSKLPKICKLCEKEGPCTVYEECKAFIDEAQQCCKRINHLRKLPSTFDSKSSSNQENSRCDISQQTEENKQDCNIGIQGTVNDGYAKVLDSNQLTADHSRTASFAPTFSINERQNPIEEETVHPFNVNPKNQGVNELFHHQQLSCGAQNQLEAKLHSYINHYLASSKKSVTGVIGEEVPSTNTAFIQTGNSNQPLVESDERRPAMSQPNPANLVNASAEAEKNAYQHTNEGTSTLLPYKKDKKRSDTDNDDTPTSIGLIPSEQSKIGVSHQPPSETDLNVVVSNPKISLLPSPLKDSQRESLLKDNLGGFGISMTQQSPDRKTIYTIERITTNCSPLEPSKTAVPEGKKRMLTIYPISHDPPANNSTGSTSEILKVNTMAQDVKTIVTEPKTVMYSLGDEKRTDFQRMGYKNELQSIHNDTYSIVAEPNEYKSTVAGRKAEAISRNIDANVDLRIKLREDIRASVADFKKRSLEKKGRKTNVDRSFLVGIGLLMNKRTKNANSRMSLRKANKGGKATELSKRSNGKSAFSNTCSISSTAPSASVNKQAQYSLTESRFEVITARIQEALKNIVYPFRPVAPQSAPKMKIPEKPVRRTSKGKKDFFDGMRKTDPAFMPVSKTYAPKCPARLLYGEHPSCRKGRAVTFNNVREAVDLKLSEVVADRLSSTMTDQKKLRDEGVKIDVSAVQQSSFMTFESLFPKLPDYHSVQATKDKPTFRDPEFRNGPKSDDQGRFLPATSRFIFNPRPELKSSRQEPIPHSEYVKHFGNVEIMKLKRLRRPSDLGSLAEPSSTRVVGGPRAARMNDPRYRMTSPNKMPYRSNY